MIAIMWQFDVRKGCEAEFEQFYGVAGEWTAMNRHARSYLGTSFLRDQNRSSFPGSSEIHGSAGHGPTKNG